MKGRAEEKGTAFRRDGRPEYRQVGSDEHPYVVGPTTKPAQLHWSGADGAAVSWRPQRSRTNKEETPTRLAAASSR